MSYQNEMARKYSHYRREEDEFVVRDMEDFNYYLDYYRNYYEEKVYRYISNIIEKFEDGYEVQIELHTDFTVSEPESMSYLDFNYSKSDKELYDKLFDSIIDIWRHCNNKNERRIISLEEVLQDEELKHLFYKGREKHADRISLLNNNIKGIEKVFDNNLISNIFAYDEYSHNTIEVVSNIEDETYESLYFLGDRFITSRDKSKIYNISELDKVLETIIDKDILSLEKVSENIKTSTISNFKTYSVFETYLEYLSKDKNGKVNIFNYPYLFYKNKDGEIVMRNIKDNTVSKIGTTGLTLSLDIIYNNKEELYKLISENTYNNDDEFNSLIRSIKLK